MVLNVGRGFVKQRPHFWHCTTANQSPLVCAAVSCASIKGVQSRWPHRRQSASSQSTPGVSVVAGVPASCGENVMGTNSFSRRNRGRGKNITLETKLVNRRELPSSSCV